MFKVNDIDRIIDRDIDHCTVVLKDGTRYKLKFGYFSFEFVGDCPEDLEKIDQQTISFLYNYVSCYGEKFFKKFEKFSKYVIR